MSPEEEKKAEDLAFAKAAFSSLMNDIGTRADELDKADVPEKKDKEKYEERRRKEDELKRRCVEVVDKYQTIVERFLKSRTYREFLSEFRLDKDSEIGAATHGLNWVLKIREKTGELHPHEVHAANVRDSVHFNSKSYKGKFRLVRFLDPFKVTEGYAKFVDRIRNTEEQKRMFLQIQPYIRGFNLDDVMQFLAKQTDSKRAREAKMGLVLGCLDDIFEFHRSAPEIPGVKVDSEQIIKRYMANLTFAVEAARKYTDCEIEDFIFDSVDRVCEQFASLYSKDPSQYTRILDSRPSNIILETSAPKLSREHLEPVLEAIEKWRVKHVDPRGRLGPPADDVTNVVDSAAFYNALAEEEPILNNDKELYEFLSGFYKEKDYDMNLMRNSLFMGGRDIRIYNFLLTSVLPRVFASRATRKDFAGDVEHYKRQMRHFAKRGVFHFNSLKDAAAESDKNELSAAAEVYADMADSIAKFKELRMPK